MGANRLIDFSEIQSTINSDSQILDYNIYVSNIDINSSKNIDSTIYSYKSKDVTILNVNGNYTGYIGLINIEDEILNVTSSIWNGNYTQMTVECGYDNTVSKNHNVGVSIRSCENITDLVDNYSYSQKSESSSSNLFSPVLSSGNIKINDNTKNWSITSNSKKYKLSKNKYIFIFEGVRTKKNSSYTKPAQLLKVFEGYIDNWYFNAKEKIITIEFKDRLNLKFKKQLTEINNYKNMPIQNILQTEFGDEVVFSNGSNASNYVSVDNISTKEFSTYGDLLNYLCSSTGTRMIYNYENKIKIFSDLKSSNISPYTTLTDNDDFLDINIETENTVIINKITCDYKNRYTYYNRNDFMKDGILNYVKFNFTTSVYLSILDATGFTPQTINIGENIKYLKIGDFVMLKDNSTGTEFYCKIADITDDGNIQVLGGFDKDFLYLFRGRLDSLISQGFSNLRNYTFYYARNELPDVFQLSLKKNGSDTTSDMQLVLLPQETKQYDCSFGGISTNDAEFSGLIEEIDDIWGIHTNTTLKYLQEQSQNTLGHPVYLQSNKLGITGTGQSEYYIYNSFDNSDISVNIIQSSDTNSDFSLEFTNNLYGGFRTSLPLSTDRNLIRIDNINNFNCGDVLTLNSQNLYIVDNLELYKLLQKERWIIQTKVIDNSTGFHYIIVNKPFPLGNNNSQFYFDLYKYNTVILVNEFRIKGNPVLETTETVIEYDGSSINLYEEQAISLDGRVLSETDLKRMIDYIKNNFVAITDSTSKYIIPFKLPFRPDVEVLDVVTLSDNTNMGMDNLKVLVLSKDVSVSVSSGSIDRQESYTAIPINLQDANANNINFKFKSNFKPVSLPTYNYTGNKGTNNQDGKENTENDYINIYDDDLGLITATKISLNDYSGKATLNVSLDNKNLTANLFGNLATYNLPVLGNNKPVLMKINNEFILCNTSNTITKTTSNVGFTILYRGVFKTDKVDIKINDIITFYDINYIKLKDLMVIGGDLHISGVNGKIIFDDSQLIIDDYKTTYSAINAKGIVFRPTESNNEIFSISELDVINSPSETFLRINSTDGRNCLVETVSSNNIPNIYAYKHSSSNIETLESHLPIKIDNLMVSDNTANALNGMIRLNNNQFQGYKNNAWSNLGENLDNIYFGVAFKNGTTATIIEGKNGFQVDFLIISTTNKSNYCIAGCLAYWNGSSTTLFATHNFTNGEGTNIFINPSFNNNIMKYNISNTSLTDDFNVYYKIINNGVDV